MKNKVLVIVLLSLVLATVLISGCFEEEIEQREALQDCTIVPVGFQVTGIDPINSLISFDITLEIYNPTDTTATLDEISYEVYANDIPLGTGRFDERTDIPPWETKYVIMSYIADTSTAPDVIFNVFAQGQLPALTVTGTAYIGTEYIGPFAIPFALEDLPAQPL